MSRCRQPLLAVGCALLLSILCGCASTAIESVGDADHSESFGRVYVLIGHQQIDSSLAERIVVGMDMILHERLHDLGIVTASQSLIHSGGDLSLEDPASIDYDDLREFAPDALLTIELSEVAWEGRRLPGTYHLRDLTYEVELRSVARNKRVWRGRVANKGYGRVGAGWKEMGSKTANEIIDRMIADKVLRRFAEIRTNPVG